MAFHIRKDILRVTPWYLKLKGQSPACSSCPTFIEVKSYCFPSTFLQLTATALTKTTFNPQPSISLFICQFSVQHPGQVSLRTYQFSLQFISRISLFLGSGANLLALRFPSPFFYLRLRPYWAMGRLSYTCRKSPPCPNYLANAHCSLMTEFTDFFFLIKPSLYLPF